MSTNRDTIAQVILEARSLGGPFRRVAATIAGFLGLCWALSLGYRPGPYQHRSVPAVATVEVDQGDVSLVVTENGFLESSIDDVVRSRVESILGLPAASPTPGGEPQPSPPTRIGSGPRHRDREKRPSPPLPERRPARSPDRRDFQPPQGAIHPAPECLQSVREILWQRVPPPLRRRI
jgi:hypothetical protein